MEPDEVERMLARADVCRFLAACYYEPTPELAEEYVFDSMLLSARRIDTALAPAVSHLGEAFLAEKNDDLLIDYTRLFLGPTDILAKPYGSWWLTGEKALMQDATVAIADLYRQAGFEMDETFHELPDHIAAELEFLYLLNYRGAQAHVSVDAAAGQGIAMLRRRFLAEHLGRWAQPFTESVEHNARTRFYKQLAVVTRLVIAGESALS